MAGREQLSNKVLTSILSLENFWLAKGDEKVFDRAVNGIAAEIEQLSQL
ncbi:MAG: hypothetical protein KDE31_05915 [Caldilineaceae bacterium]|nr:hypothetical protein [Caldilineaceae bacterium]